MNAAAYRRPSPWPLERIGWSNAEFWMRRQASYDLSVARRQLSAAGQVVTPAAGELLKGG